MRSLTFLGPSLPKRFVSLLELNHIFFAFIKLFCWCQLLEGVKIINFPGSVPFLKVSCPNSFLLLYGI
ncbi:hypothetical protein L6164_026264 [Bauhinia variegata]|uniref:Uncharacterized protein n=1 Tax=Bauhinia variegata TaxID=167791 RepID=A0ACB9LQK1_BAUVA|nr:hypothetical protein L6164_026264 [Bauhinia variegata]